MKKFWQTEWQGILFSTFAKLSSTELAGEEFYNAFYRAFFERYRGYQDLDQKWRGDKDVIANWIARQLPSNACVLSVGCGLGYVEQKLWNEHGDRIEIHVTDYANDAMRWLREVIPENRIHDAADTAGGLGELEFDLIYLSAIDYALTDHELIHLLVQLKERLKINGRLVIVSASYLDQSFSFSRIIKDIVKIILDISGLRSRGQFWGWMRSRTEYQNLMNLSGFNVVDDGYINMVSQTYWISGKGSAVDV